MLKSVKCPIDLQFICHFKPKIWCHNAYGKNCRINANANKRTQDEISGLFSADNIQSSVPKALLELVCMIEHGPDIQSQLDNKMTKSDLAIAQLLMYNYHSKQSKQPRQQRHAQEREPPLCIYIGLLIYRYFILIRFITTRRSRGRTLFVWRINMSIFITERTFHYSCSR